MVVTEFQQHLHISHSQLETFLTWPRRYQYQYVLGLPWEHIPAGLVLGKALHAAVAYYYRHVKALGTPLPLEILKACFEAELTEVVAGGPEVLYKEGEDAETLKAKGLALLEVFHAQVKPQQVQAVEMPFLVDLVDPKTGEVLEAKLAGVFDLIEADEQGHLIIADLKTSNRRYGERQVEDNLQATLYAYALKQLGFTTDGQATLIRFDVLLKTKQPALESYFAVKREDDYRWTLTLVTQVLQAIEAKAYYPNPSWRCPECPFRGRCQSEG